MKRALVIVFIFLLLLGFTCAEIVLREQPQEQYNLGERVALPLTVKATNPLTGMLSANLLCGSEEINFYKNGVTLLSGEEVALVPSLILSKEIIGESLGSCVIKVAIGQQYVVTEPFVLTKALVVEAEPRSLGLQPGETTLLEGTAKTATGRAANGFVDVELYSKDATEILATTKGTLTKGFFEVNVSLKANRAAGAYTLLVHAYEKGSDEQITNEGYDEVSLEVFQIPKNLELIFDKTSLLPGEELSITPILHDQTGENIKDNVTLAIFNEKGKILERVQMLSAESFVFSFAADTEPQILRVVADSGKQEATASVSVEAYAHVDISLLDKTLVLRNTGNVAYCNKPVLVKIGGQSLNVNPCLDVGKQATYTLSAPNGEYAVEVVADETQQKQSVTLTGKAVAVEEQGGVLEFASKPFTWIIAIVLLSVITVGFYRRETKRHRVGVEKKGTLQPLSSAKAKKPLVQKLFTVNPAELCLSIQGERQRSLILHLRVRNMKTLLTNPEGVRETIGKLSSLVQQYKVSVYENQENVFFLFVPKVTRTFQNETHALELAQKMKEVLDYHNRLFKEPIDYTLSLAPGEIVARTSSQGVEFMTLGDVITRVKKMSALAKAQILLDNTLREKMGNNVRVEKITKDGVSAYKLDEVKHNAESEKFIRRFLERMEKK